MSKIKSILAFVALMLCGGAWAVEPVVSWGAGEIATGDKNGFTVSIRDTDSSAVSIANGEVSVVNQKTTASYGLQIAFPNSFTTTQAAILIEYSDYSISTTGNGNNCLIAATWGDQTTAHETMVHGTSGKQFSIAQNVYANNDGGGVLYGSSVAIPETGYMLMTMSGSGDWQGTRVAYAKKTGRGLATSFVEALYKDNVKEANGTFAGIKLGGTIASCGKYYRPQMKIQSIKIFDTAVTAADLNSDAKTSIADDYKCFYDNFADRVVTWTTTASTASTGVDIGNAAATYKSYDIVRGESVGEDYKGNGTGYTVLPGWTGSTTWAWRAFCSGQAGYTAPGLVMRFPTYQAGSSLYVKGSFGPFTLGGLIVEENAGSGTTKPKLEWDKDRETALGDTRTSGGVPTFFILKDTFQINRGLNINVYGDITFDIASGKLLEIVSGKVVPQSGAILRLKGAGQIKTAGVVNSSGSKNIDLSGITVDFSGKTSDNNTAYFDGQLTVSNTTKWHFPACLAANQPFKLCTGTLTAPSDLVIATITVGGVEKEDVRIKYDATAKTVTYSTGESDYWTPNTDNTDAITDGILDWTADYAWLDENNDPATWPTDTATASEINVKIDAARIDGVKIDGQIYANDVSVECSDKTEHAFEFHNNTTGVSGTTTTDAATDCLHATLVDLKDYKGDLGLKVPISCQINFSTATHLIFRTAGAGQPASKAYTYNIVGRAGAIQVSGDGKFEVPSTMYDLPFSVDQTATIVYNINQTISGQITGEGKVSLEGNSMFSGANQFSGGLDIAANKTAQAGAHGCFGRGPINVGAGGTMNFGGYQAESAAYAYQITTAAGVRFEASGSLYANHNVIKSLTVNGDLELFSTGRIGLSTTESGTATSITLNNSPTITVNCGYLNLRNTTITGEGTIKVKDGKYLLVYADGTGKTGLNAADTTIVLESGAKFELNATGTASTVKNLTLKGTVDQFDPAAKGTLTITGTLTAENESGVTAIPVDTTVANVVKNGEGALLLRSNRPSGTIKLNAGTIKSGLENLTITSDTACNVVHSDVEDGLYTYSLNIVAKVDGVPYSTIADAISAATTSDKSVVLVDSSLTVPGEYAETFVKTTVGSTTIIRKKNSLIDWKSTNAADWGAFNEANHVYATQDGLDTTYEAGDTICFVGTEIKIYAKTATHGAKIQIGKDADHTASVGFTRSGENCDDYILSGSAIEIKSGSSLHLRRWAFGDGWDSYQNAHPDFSKINDCTITGEGSIVLGDGVAASFDGTTTVSVPVTLEANATYAQTLEITDNAVVEVKAESAKITCPITGAGTIKLMPSLTTQQLNLWKWINQANSMNDFAGTIHLAASRFRFDQNDAAHLTHVKIKVTDGAQAFMDGNNTTTWNNTFHLSGNGYGSEMSDIGRAALRLGGTNLGATSAIIADDGDAMIGVHTASKTIPSTITAEDGIIFYAHAESDTITFTGSITGSVTKEGAGKIVIPTDCTATFTLLAGTIQSTSSELDVTTTVEGKAVGCVVTDGTALYSLVDPVASITVSGETRNYVSLEAAITAAKKGETVTLLAASNETITIPENVTVDPGNQSFTGTIKGSGTYIVHYSNNSRNMTQPPNGVTAPEWTGTIWVIGNGENANANDFNCTDTGKALYSHVGSKLALTGINGYFKCFNGGTVAAKEVKLFDDGTTKALVIGDGAAANGFLIKKLTGTGTLADRDNGPANRGVTIEDASEFEGNIDVSYKMAVKLGTSEIGSGTAKTIVVSGAVKGKNQTWTAGSGITFENSATIDITDGALITSSAVTFNADITIKGGAEGSTVMTASGAVTGSPTVTLINQDGVEVEGDFTLAKDANNQVKIVQITTPIATVGGVECKTLKAAIKLAQSTGNPIVLTSDLTVGGNIVPSGVVIDLDGHNLTGTLQLQSGAYILEGTGEDKKVKIDGFATSIDVTYGSGTINSCLKYSAFGGLSECNGNNPAYTTDGDAIMLSKNPWLKNVNTFFTSTEQITFATAGIMPKANKTIFAHMGSKSTWGLFLATGTNSTDVVIGYNEGLTPHEITTINVPNARTHRHTYIITKNDNMSSTPTKTTFVIYLDGIKWKTFERTPRFEITGGFQVGSTFEGIINDFKAVGNTSGVTEDVAYVNFMRAYDRIISSEEIKAYTDAYPYTSPNGTYKRSVTADGNWVSENAWNGNAEKPTTNGNVELSIDTEGDTVATLDVNLADEVEYEKLTIKSESGKAVKFTRTDTNAKPVKSVCTVIGTDVTLGENTLDLKSGPTVIVEGGKLKFDFSGLPASAVAAEHQGVMTEIVTGDIDKQDGDVVSIIRPTDQDIKSAELVYNENHYEVLIKTYAARVGEGETAQRFDTIAEALTADQANNYANVVILNGTKVLPDGYGNYAVADDGHIVTTVKARTPTKGFVSLAAAAAYCEEGDVIELLADDSSAVVLNKDITIDISANRTISGVISGNYSITKTGSSTLTLSGANTFTGLNVNAGTVKGGASANKSATPFGSLEGTITIADGATLDIDKATLGNADTNNGFGYTIVSNGGTITKSTANGDNAFSKLIKSLTLNKDMTISGNTIGVGVKSSDVQGAIVLNGHTLTVNMSGEWNNVSGLGNFYLYNVEVSGSGTINVVKGNLLTHTVGSTATNAKLIIGSQASTQIEATLDVKELEIKGLNNKTSTQNLTVSTKLTVDVNSAYTLNAKVVPAETCEWVVVEGTTLTVSGNRTTQGINGGGKLINTSGNITAKNKPSGYAVDDATVQIDGGTFTVNLGNGDPQIRNAKFVINGGELKTYGWVTMVGTIELDAASDKTILGGTDYNPSFRGTPNIIKSGDGNVTIKAGVDTGAKFSSLTLNGGSLTLTADVTVDNLVSGVAHKTVAYNSTTRTYSLVGPIATVGGVDCFTKEDLAAHPQGTLEILDTNRVTIDGNQVLVDGVALPLITIDGENVLSPAKEAEGDTGLRISEICPKLTLWDENHRDAGWLEVVNNGTAYANLKDYNIARFNRGKEVKKVTDWKCGVDVWIAPGARAVIKTSEDYPGADDKQITQYGADLNNALVLGAKINPKKYPVVVLAKGKTTIQKCAVPVDVPENKSVCYDGALKNGATVSYITTATKGTANDFTNAVAVGPQVTSLYGVADAPDPWIAFPKATKDAPYSVTLPVNPVYGVEENEANSITKVQLIYQIGFTTPVTNDTEMVKSGTKDATKGWLYTGTIPASALTEAGQVVKFAVKITDGAGNTWRSPSFNNPEDGFQWYGTIIEPTADQTDGGITTLHIFADPDEVADTPGSDHSSATALMNIDADNASYKTQKHPYGAYVGIYDNDTGMYYDSVRIDRRGNTTGKFTKKAHGLKFAKAQPFTGKDSVSGKTIECRKSSFTAEYADPAFVRQELSFKMMNDNGSPAPFHYPVRLNLNGAFYQLAFHTERFSDELIEDFYGLDGKGYGYKNIGPFNPGLKPVSGGIEKKTPDDGVTSDNGVLDAFCRKMEDVELISEGHTQGNPTPTADSEFETEFSRTLTKVVTTDFDLPAWLNYIALTKITGETDDVWANLSGYYDINGTGTWMPLVYDTNQSFGQWHKSDDPNMATEMANAGKNCANYDHFKAHPLYGGHHIMVHYSGGAPYSAANNGSMATKPYKGNRCFEAIFQNAKYRRLYLRRLRTLMDAEFGGASADQEHTPMYQRAKEMVKRYSAVAEKDREIWTNYETSAQELWVFGHKEAGWTAEDGLEWIWDNYIQKRREHLYVTHAAEGHEGQIGYGETLCAGIPAAQSSIDTLKGKFAVEWDNAHQAVVLKNKNAEAVDVSGWAVAGRIAFVFPAGTVIDQGTETNPGLLYITANRKHTVELFGNDINDQTIIGNGAPNADVDAIVVRTDKGLRILGEATDQETSIRFESIYGNTTGDGDTGEWFTLKNIGSAADVNLEGMTICILKDGDPESGTHCHVTLTSKSKPGTLASGASKKFEQSKFVDYGFGKIQNNKLNIKLYDKYGINYQTLAVTQKEYPIAYGKGAYLVADKTTATVKKGDWHQVYDAAVQGNLKLQDWTKKEDSFNAMDKDLTVLVNDKVTIDLQNPTFGEKASLKLKGTGVATIKGTATKTNGTGTVINSEGSLVFEDGTYTFTTENDCIQADGDITINGGTFICHSTGNDGIDANGDIIINGGTIYAFTAATEEDNAKSTGLDVNDGHSITINGGTVIATSLEAAALNKLTLAGSQAAKVVEVTGLTADEAKTIAIADILVPFPAMATVPTAVLVSKPGMTADSTVVVEEEAPDTVEIVAEDAEAGTDAVHATVPASWKTHAAVTAGTITEKQAAEAFVLGLAEPTEKPMVSSEQTTEADSIRIVDNVAPRFGTGVVVKRTLFVGTTPGVETESEIKESDNGFTVPLPTGNDKVKYLKIKYSFE